MKVRDTGAIWRLTGRTLWSAASEISPGLAYAMGWAAWTFGDAAPPGEKGPAARSHGGDWLGANNLMLILPEEKMGLVLLTNSHDPTASSTVGNIAFDVALLALGRELRNYPPEEGWITRNLRAPGATL